MERKYVLATIGILVAFAIGLVGYFAFSAMYGDGLEKTMQNNGIEEQPPVYQAPLDYGSDYASALIAGIIGFAVTLAAMYGYLVISRRIRKTDQ